jgi:hypothetical protein
MLMHLDHLGMHPIRSILPSLAGVAKRLQAIQLHQPSTETPVVPQFSLL